MLLTIGIAPLYVAYNFMFWESVEIIFPQQTWTLRSFRDAASQELMETPESILYFPWFLTDGITPSSLTTSCRLTLECCESKMLISKLTVDLCDFLIAEWETNSNQVQSISSHCPRVRSFSIFTPGYNHSKTSLPSHLNWLAATEVCLDQVRSGTAHHLMYQLCPGIQLIPTLTSKPCVCNAECKWQSQS